MSPAAGTAAGTGRLVRVAGVEEVPPGWVLKVVVDDLSTRWEIALANSNGTIFALENACSHAGGPLGDNRLKDGCHIECPWHNAVFDARTGAVVRGPARKAVRTYLVHVVGADVFVSLPGGERGDPAG